jgi:hypothetical protein
MQLIIKYIFNMLWSRREIAALLQPKIISAFKNRLQMCCKCDSKNAFGSKVWWGKSLNS